ncbi:superoxide dismutase [Cu-Zn]-like isoform X4 [Leucoraja erinacea]|uniref:superoxide dismutase [Cu-Zn]-like isoform X4 n=1 Tax=Leucoraja erinaceus TaxID=7782 RepID=UPI002453C123|nr:superoxide dismutase [Cu-Zn]-like isoform X4 [Leucoraja erinacea]
MSVQHYAQLGSLQLLAVSSLSNYSRTDDREKARFTSDIANWISAGPHYNPYNKTNGAQQENRYAGVLGIVNANEDGLAKMDLQVSHLHLTGINSIIGRTLVIHQSEDEPGKSDKEDSTIAGSEGNGVAWGVIGICQSNISEEYLEEKN